MKNKNLKIVLIIATIIIIASGAGVYATYSYFANNVSYSKGGTEISVQAALDDLYSKNDGITELTEFKRDISDYIEEAGGIKPDYNANSETFGTSIKNIVKEVTSDATASGNNITSGQTAYVNGNKITGTGVDNNTYYENGKEEGKRNLTLIESNLSSRYEQNVTVTNIANYQNLTVDNFIIVNKSLAYANVSDEEDILEMSKSYAKNTGELTLGKQKSYSNVAKISGMSYTFYNIYDVYLLV